MKKYLILIFSLLGLIDASYLTYEHYQNIIPPCTINRLLPILSDCGQVLRSPYSIVFGIPLALMGVFQYAIIILITLLIIFHKNKLFPLWLFWQTVIGLLASLYFMYLQLFLIKNICIYCTLSAIISFCLFYLTFILFRKERTEFRLKTTAFLYQYLLRQVLFLIDSEMIHDLFIKIGENMGKTALKKLIAWNFKYVPSRLRRKLAGINFPGPIGLAAGFDYNAQLTQLLPSFGFGFQTVGTVTNEPYEGNPPPRLGRLPKLKALIVNKGFKNLGAQKISQQLKKLDFEIPLGISIGISNNRKIKTIDQALKDIISAFKTFEKEKVKNSYYELNISCPNLINTNIDLHILTLLNKLLGEIKKLSLKKPVFVKMPIEKSNREFLAMLSVIINYFFIKGVVIGNLKKTKICNLSGKPCEQRSNELIELTYKKYKNRLIIIGCGGVFSAEDAYHKIKLGASLVQLITGMIYQGPQLISQINLELEELLIK